MGRWGLLSAVAAATSLAVACGSTAVENPVAPSSSPSPSPSSQMPSLMGQWRGTGSLELTRADGSSFGSHGCPSFWTVQSQDGGVFSGLVDVTGNGSASDKVCGPNGSFTGTMSADSAIVITVNRAINQACKAAGDSTVFTGVAGTDGTLFLQTSAAVTCDYSQAYETGTLTLTFNLWRPTR
jgi:hypothetical protein